MNRNRRRGSFISLVLAGELEPDAISDAIDEWHSSGETGISLHEYLGLEWREYQLWVEMPHALAAIVEARRRDLALPDLLHQGDDLGMTPSERTELTEWLRKVERW